MGVGGWLGGGGGGHPVGAGVTLVLLLDGLAVYFAMCIYEGGWAPPNFGKISILIM